MNSTYRVGLGRPLSSSVPAPRRGRRSAHRSPAERATERTTGPVGPGRSWDEQVLVGRERRQAGAAELVARRLVSEVLGR